MLAEKYLNENVFNTETCLKPAKCLLFLSPFLSLLHAGSRQTLPTITSTECIQNCVHTFDTLNMGLSFYGQFKSKMKTFKCGISSLWEKHEAVHVII